MTVTLARRCQRILHPIKLEAVRCRNRLRLQGRVKRVSGIGWSRNLIGFGLHREVVEEKVERRYIEWQRACKAASGIEEGAYGR
jgi:hypothetical protein